MNRIGIAAALCAISLPAAPGPTRLCASNPYVFNVLLWGVSAPLAQRIQATVAAPASDPAFAALLGDVTRVETRSGFGDLYPFIELFYNPVDNTPEIVDRLNADPGLRSQLNYPASANGYGCFAAGLFPATRVTVTEYHNVIVDHYFLSSSDAENRAIDSGAAGPGWQRTGETFNTYQPEPCVGPYVSKWVYRFYGTPGVGANSHFFTAGPAECGGLRNGIGWTYEGRAFGAELPNAGICPANAPVPVYRAYNMRWAQNDSNHRHTTSLATYQQMIARGWAGEGIAFCVPN